MEAATGLLIGWALCNRWRHRVAIAALFLLGTAAFPLADAHAASFEGFMVLPMTAAWWFSRKGRALPAAVALAVATLVKQSAVFTIIPIAYNLWRGPNGPRRVAVMAAGSVGLYLVVGHVVRPAPVPLLEPHRQRQLPGGVVAARAGRAGRAHARGLRHRPRRARVDGRAGVGRAPPEPRPLAVAGLGVDRRGHRSALLRPLLPAGAAAARRAGGHPDRPDPVAQGAAGRGRSPPRSGSW